MVTNRKIYKSSILIKFIMNEVPKTVVLELEDDDVRQDLVSIVNSMESIRREEIVDGITSEERKNEYLHLTARLASTVEALADNKLLEKMNSVVKQFDVNPALFAYDYLQESFWRKNDPEFSKLLDQVLIGLKGDDFSGLREKQHILNALKYLGARDEDLERKIEIYNTIVPFSSINHGESKKLAEDALSKHAIVKIKENGNLEVKKVSNMDDFLNVARFFGFASVNGLITNDQMGQLSRDGIYMDKAEKVDMKKIKDRMRLVANTVKYTKSISYPMIGLLPGFFQGRIERRFNETGINNAFNSRSASISSGVVEGCFGTGLLVYSVATRNITPYLGPGFALMIEGFARADISRTCPGCHDGFGSLFLKILLLPFEEYMKHYRDKKKGVKRDGQLSLVEFKIPRNEMKGEYDGISYTHNYHSELEELAQKQLPEKIEDNLIWSEGNHHTFGTYFRRELTKDVETEIPIQNIKRSVGALSLGYKLFDDPYEKRSSIVCFKGRRYVMTSISTKRDIDFDEVSKILYDEKKLSDRFTDLFKLTDAEYLHLTEFNNNVMGRSLVATN